jgi:hypothetical protein
MKDGRLPVGMTPRLLSKEAAAAYCGMSPSHLDDHVARTVPPLKFGKRNLWDIKALDHWLDGQSGLVQADRPIDEWVERLGNDRSDKGR